METSKGQNVYGLMNIYHWVTIGEQATQSGFEKRLMWNVRQGRNTSQNKLQELNLFPDSLGFRYQAN